MCGVSQKDVTGELSRSGKIRARRFCTLYSDVPLGREVRARQQQQPGDECPKHEAHRQRKRTVKLLKSRAAERHNGGILEALRKEAHDHRWTNNTTSEQA